MKVGIGSKNKTKVGAIVEILKDYPMFDGAEIEGVAVVIEEFGHPKTLDETVAGAVNRAKQAYVDHDYGFGIEGGLMQVPYTKTGYMEVGACAIFDGKQTHIGLSPGFEWPQKVLNKIFHEGMDGSQAMRATGIIQEEKGEKAGEQKGLIHMFTKGRMDRTELNKLAVMMALAHLENPEHY